MPPKPTTEPTARRGNMSDTSVNRLHDHAWCAAVQQTFNCRNARLRHDVRGIDRRDGSPELALLRAAGRSRYDNLVQLERPFQQRSGGTILAPLSQQYPEAVCDPCLEQRHAGFAREDDRVLEQALGRRQITLGLLECRPRPDCHDAREPAGQMFRN